MLCNKISCYFTSYSIRNKNFTTMNPRRQLIAKAYIASGYKPTFDPYVLRDRDLALNKLSDSELNCIIATKIASDLKAWNNNQPAIRKRLMNDYLVKP